MQKTRFLGCINIQSGCIIMHPMLGILKKRKNSTVSNAFTLRVSKEKYKKWNIHFRHEPFSSTESNLSIRTLSELYPKSYWSHTEVIPLGCASIRHFNMPLWTTNNVKMAHKKYLGWRKHLRCAEFLVPLCSKERKWTIITSYLDTHHLT